MPARPLVHTSPRFDPSRTDLLQHHEKDRNSVESQRPLGGKRRSGRHIRVSMAGATIMSGRIASLKSGTRTQNVIRSSVTNGASPETLAVRRALCSRRVSIAFIRRVTQPSITRSDGCALMCAARAAALCRPAYQVRAIRFAIVIFLLHAESIQCDQTIQMFMKLFPDGSQTSHARIFNSPAFSRSNLFTFCHVMCSDARQSAPQRPQRSM